MMKSENFDARNMENGALDRKLWLWKLWRVKIVFSEGYGGICGIFSGRKLQRERIGALAKFGKKFRGFLLDFLGVWSG
jgi:hypothetical protein